MKQEVASKKTESKKKFIITAFLIAFLPRLVFLLDVYPMSVAGDESFMFMPVAQWAGLDWSGNAGSYRYYGYGFVALLTPLFRIVEDPVILYRIIVAMMILMQALVAPISYHMMKKYFAMKDSLITVLISVISSYLVFLRAVYVYNEFIYDLFVWIIIWCLLKLIQIQGEKKKRIGYTAILMLLLVYQMTIHSRAITLWLALAVTTMVYFWVYRKFFLSLPVTIILGGAGYLLSQKGISLIVGMFTEADSISEVGNTSVSFSISSVLSSAKSGIAWIYIVLGQLNTMSLVTGGVAVLMAGIACHLLWKSIIHRKEAGQAEKNYVVVFAFGLSAAAITILGQAFSWLPGVVQTIESGVSNDAMRAVTYLRYYGIYFVPVFMVGLVWCYQYRARVKTVLLATSFITVFLQGFWCIFILPYVSDFNGTSWESNAFSWTKGWEDTIRIRTYLPAVFFSLLFFAVFVYLLIKRKYRWGLLALCAVLMYSYGFNCVYHEGERGKINYTYVDKTYSLVQDLDKKGIEPEEIYVEDTSFPETGQSLVSECQFVLKDKKIISGIPWNAECENILFITCDSREKTDLLKKGFLCAQIDENEYWYVKGKDLQEAITSEGIDLKEYMKNVSKIPLNRIQSDVKISGNGFGYMDSNGEEGWFVYGYEIPFSGGNLNFKINLQVSGWENEKLGEFQLWRNGELFDSIDLLTSDIDEEGYLDMEYDFEGCEAESLEPRIYLDFGSKVRLKGALYERNSNSYKVGSTQETGDELVTAVQKAGDDLLGVGYFTVSELAHPETSNLEKSLKIPVKVSQDPQEEIVVAPETQENLFFLCQDYMLLYRVKGYDVWKKINGQDKQETGLSGEYGVLAQVFRRNQDDHGKEKSGIRLKGGRYKITHVLPAESLKDQDSVNIKIFNWGEYKEEKTATISRTTDCTKYTYELEIQEESELEFYSQVGEKSILDNSKIYIQKTGS